GVRYSFTGAITEPRQVLKGGYLSWHEPVSDHWFQASFFGAAIAFRDLGPIDSSKGSLRSQIDAMTMNQTLNVLKPKKAALTAATKRSSLGNDSSKARAESLKTQIASLVKKAKSATVDT